MKKHLSIFLIVLLIISALTTTTGLLAIQAQDTDQNVDVDKTATAYNVTCSQEILVILTVNGTGVGGPVDVMLVIDRSGSMQNGPLDAAKAAAKSFIDNLNFTGDPATSDWIGISSYATTASLDQGLTGDPTLAKSAIDGLSAVGYTNIMASVHVAQEELATNGRDHVVDVMIVLSDGVANRWTDFDKGITYWTATWPSVHTTSTLKAIEEAQAAKDAGTMVFTIGLNLDDLEYPASEWVARDTLQQMATSPDHSFDAAEPGFLEEIYEEIARLIRPAGTDLTITDVVAPEFIIDETTIDPAASVTGNTITWKFDVLGTENKTFRYRIRPIQGLHGWYPTNVEATLNYTDSEGKSASLPFPNPQVYLERVCESAIQLNKTVDQPLIHPGQKVTYTYNVTNPGPYPLHSVNLTDDQYMEIAGPFDLAVGETKTFTYPAWPTETVTNWGNATGLDPWNYPVTDLDDATVEVITECTVTFYIVPPEGGDISIVGGKTYLDGESDIWDYCTTLTAIANAHEGYEFVGWDVTGNLNVTEEIGNEITFHIECGGNLTAIFRPEITPEPRTIGFWKHQVYVYLRNRGTAQVTEDQLLDYLEQVSLRSALTLFQGMYEGDNDITLQNAFEILWGRSGWFVTRTGWMKARAEAQLLATWLNTVSGKLSMGTHIDSTIYGGLETVGEAIAYCESILMNSSSTFHDYEEAKTICDKINNGIGIMG